MISSSLNNHLILTCITCLSYTVLFFKCTENIFLCIITGDVIAQQFEKVVFNEAKAAEFMSFRPSEKSRVDVFLRQYLQSYPELWTFCQSLLLLSHGQAEVERGFSTNKEVETCNMAEDTVITQRLICDHVKVCGGVAAVPLTKELISYCASARSRYREHLEEERRKKEKEEQSKKRKNIEDDLEGLKKNKWSIEEVCKSIESDADQMAEQAENSAGSKMATLITKSNTMRRRAKEKQEELKGVNGQN